MLFTLFTCWQWTSIRSKDVPQPTWLMMLNYLGSFNKSKEDCLGLRICWCLQLSRRETSISFSNCFDYAPCRISSYVTIENHEFMAINWYPIHCSIFMVEPSSSWKKNYKFRPCKALIHEQINAQILGDQSMPYSKKLSHMYLALYSTERNVKHQENCELSQGIVLIGCWLRSISHHWNCNHITVLAVVPIESIQWQLCCTVRLGPTWDWQSCHTPAITRPPCAVAPA